MIDNLAVKECSKCKQTLQVLNFHYDGRSKDNLNSWCKKCVKAEATRIGRTRKGWAGIIRGRHITRSKAKGWPIPTYSKEELLIWCNNRGNFNSLFEAWEKSNYDKMLVPSIDRKDSNGYYTFDNLQLMSWKEHLEKTKREKRDGGLDKQNQCVSQYTEDGLYVDSYHSMYQASNALGVTTNMNLYFSGKYTHVAGFQWKKIDTYPTMYEKIQEWARTRNLYEYGDPKSQALKLIEEVAELTQAIMKNDKEEAADAVADCIIVLVNLATQMDINVDEALYDAFKEIGPRKGKMINGTFVKG